MSTPITFDGSDGRSLHGRRWAPAGDPVGIVQLAHGMGEHIGRYDAVAEALTVGGFLVVGHDHRGHGANVDGEPGDLGPDGWAALVADLGRLNHVVRSQHPDLPLALVAHSMGSFAAQQYLLDHSDDIDAVVLSGTGAIDVIEAGIDPTQEIDLSAFNAPFEPARTPFDWLSRDEAQVDAYNADEGCGFGLDATNGAAMFAGGRRLADPEQVARIRSDLPLLITVGDHDPVNAGMAALTPLLDRFRTAGLTDVTLSVHPGARHEVFNETNRDEIVAEVVTWLQDRLASASS